MTSVKLLADTVLRQLTPTLNLAFRHLHEQ